MNLRSIDLNLLPVLEAVYDERSLTRASEILRITQPAVSNALSRLRTHFEDPLFVREGRGVKPTAMAEALMPAVRDALDRLRTGLEPRSVFEPSRSTRVFNISARDAGSFLIAPALAARLEEAAPGVRISWSQLHRSAVRRNLPPDGWTLPSTSRICAALTWSARPCWPRPMSASSRQIIRKQTIP